MKEIVLIKVKDFGEIEVIIENKEAPITVENFLNLVKENYYDNSSFHRVISGFMIQGGIGRNNAKPIVGEFSSNNIANNLKHQRGVISMARTMVPNSATSQFFIMHENSPHLDNNYASFGYVTKGIEVVDKIAGVETDHNDKPLKPVIIESIRIIENKS